MSEFHFLQPLDVLYLRGNRLFGDSSATGEAIMPPWPSMAAGAIRSQILASLDVDSGQFAQGKALITGALAQSLGTPDQPGDFRVSHFLLAKYQASLGATPTSRPTEQVEVYLPLPADVVVLADNSNKQPHYLQPHPLPAAIQTSAHCPQIPVLRTAKQAKPEAGLWLNSAGIQAWLNSQAIDASHLVESKSLWKIDSRLGIALDAQGRTTDDGQLYTVETVALAEDIGFLTGIAGAENLLPANGVLRLGGDGRGAQHSQIVWQPPQPDWELIAQTKRFRLLLTTPGLFEQGWLLPGMTAENGGYLWKTPDISAHLVTASTARAETISGWDIASNQPKPALKAVSSGSVYWFNQFEGDISALQKLVEHSLFHIDAYPDQKRCAEGFNNIMIAAWPL
ncbi:MAG: type III-B CRISPR module-associated protein Cmr3 [Proteobacteria bacterium ST_bin11]|nr:MAG: type III-B CRISPR module-associated protein Cmr3 [Proteobacteria bacterium ST_bin11]